MLSDAWPCKECGGEREHFYGCAVLDRIAAPFIEALDMLDILCGDEPSSGSLVKRERMNAAGTAIVHEWVRVCICVVQPEPIDGICPNCQRERA